MGLNDYKECTPIITNSCLQMPRSPHSNYLGACCFFLICFFLRGRLCGSFVFLRLGAILFREIPTYGVICFRLKASNGFGASREQFPRTRLSSGLRCIWSQTHRPQTRKYIGKGLGSDGCRGKMWHSHCESRPLQTSVCFVCFRCG